MAHLALPLHAAVGVLEIDAQSSAVEGERGPNVKAKGTDAPFAQMLHTDLV